PWKLAKPQPMLRCIDNVAHIAQMLADGLSAAHGYAPAHEAAHETTAAAAQGPSAQQPISDGIPAAQGLAQSA
ncbi:MAG: hypothetical protein AAF862_09475, partial [Pseudomonadota bacterium]